MAREIIPGKTRYLGVTHGDLSYLLILDTPMRRERAEICTANMQISGEHAHIVICETQQTAKRYAKILERSFVNLKARGPSAMLPE